MSVRSNTMPGNQHSKRYLNSLCTDVATRSNIIPWLKVYGVLPNPDPILRKISSRIEILHEIKRDPQVSACTISRKAGVRKRKWKIDRKKASAYAAETIEKIFKNLPVRSIVHDMLGCWGYGYAPMEILWKREGDLIVPSNVIGISPEFFVFGNDNELRIRRKTWFETDPVEQYKFLLAQYEASYTNPYGDADYSLCFWPVTFKKGGIKQWAIFMESTGMPHAIGKLPRSADKEEREYLLNALGNMIRDAAAVIPDDASVELLEVKGENRSGEMYDTYTRYHDGEISKAILGYSTAVDSTSGSLGNESVAMDVRADIIEDDSATVMECFDVLIRYIHELNPTLGSARPEFKLYDKKDVKTKRAERDFKLLDTGKIIFTKKYLTKHYDYNEDEIIVH